MSTDGRNDRIAGRAIGELIPDLRRRGRGARSNAAGRFDIQTVAAVDDGWGSIDGLEPLKTTVRRELARAIIARNDSPDISFDQSINPYRGCEHGCSYCYARPTHAFLGHSPGLDFEALLYAKTNAAALLRGELSRPRYRPRCIALGTVTDAYQPIERYYRITRELLEVLVAYRHPAGIVTKSALVERDLDLLQCLARDQLIKVAISVTTLDGDLARRMEPRASTPSKRLDALRRLSAAGIPTQVMVAPIIPGLNDSEIERILAAAAAAGAREAGYVLLRLPLELKDLFREWLVTEFPGRANKVLKLLQGMHGGQDYSTAFGRRQTGTGPYAELIARRFRLACKLEALNVRRLTLRTDLFRRPPQTGEQLNLFGG